MMASLRSGPVIAVGELLWDMLPAGPRLGGTTANFAIGCARLGHEAALISCVGEDSLGRDALSLLEAETRGLHFDLSLIQKSASAPTGTVDVKLGADGHPEYSIATPSAWDEIQLLPPAENVLSRASALCFGTLAQREPLSRQTIRALVENAGPDCLRVHDVNLRPPFYSGSIVLWSLQHADVIKISEEELPLVNDFLETKPGTLEDAAHALLGFAKDCQLVAITRGSQGSLLVTRHEANAHPGFPVRVVDTVGAGDAFTSGMVHACLSGASLDAVNRAANLCGSYVAGQPGATPPFSAKLLGDLRETLG